MALSRASAKSGISFGRFGRLWALVGIVERLVPDELWELFQRVVPEDPSRLITEQTGLPISVGILAANLHDSQTLIRLVKGIPPIRSRRGPRRRKPGKLHGDKGYDYFHLRRWLRGRGITHRIACIFICYCRLKTTPGIVKAAP